MICRFDDCTGIFLHNYQEYAADFPIDFQGTCYGVTIAGGWIALSTNPWAIANVNGLIIKHVDFANITVTLAGTVSNAVIGNNHNAGSATFPLPTNYDTTFTPTLTFGGGATGMTGTFTGYRRVRGKIGDRSNPWRRN